MNRNPHTELERWLAAEAAGDDAAAEEAFGALFEALPRLAPRVGFTERVVYREYFPRGLTALDRLDEATLGTRPGTSHVTAQQEVEALLAVLKLPINEPRRARASAREEWIATSTQPIEALEDVLAD